MKGTISVVSRDEKNNVQVLVKDAGLVDYKKGEVSIEYN